MRTIESDTSDCVLVVGVSRPKIALALLTLMLLSLFLTFHVLYDSALSSLQNTYYHRQPHHHHHQQQHQRTPPVISTSDPQQDQMILFNDAEKIDDAEIEAVDGVADAATESGVVRIHLPRTARKRLPQAIIVGVRKCGTRALLEMLYLHPMIQRAAGEVHFFDRDENYRRGLDWYRNKMPYSLRGQITIEKSPSYFITPEVPERIRAMNASIKLLVIVREPVTRAISDYTQLRSHAAATAPPTQQPQPPPRSFEQLALQSGGGGEVNAAYKPLAISMYHTHMHRWLEVFPRHQIFIVNGDQLIEDPVPQIQRIERFLHLPPRIHRHNFYFNETKGFYCLRNRTSDKCLRETKGRRHPRVDPQVISKLRRFFSEHNQKFYELVGEDLGWPEE